MYEVLSAQFEETKESLKSVEETIRRLTGRDPDAFTPSGNIKWKKNGKLDNFQSLKRPAVSQQNSGFQGSVVIEEDVVGEDEESADEEVPEKKPALLSAVVTTQKSVKTRKDTLAEQKGDKKILARNRRMFGMILGTLQKFQSEESRRKDQAIKRAEIDKKVEEAAEKEKELMKQEKQQLFKSRKAKQIQIRCLEKKMEIAEIYQDWEKHHKLLGNFIQTTAKPPIMFLPAKHSSKSQKSLQSTREGILALIAAKREKLEKELADIDECYKRDTLNLNSETAGKENFGPNEDDESRDSALDDEEMTMDSKSEHLGDDEQHNGNSEATINQNSLGDFSESMDHTDRQASNLSEPGEYTAEAKPVEDHDEFEPIYD